MTDRATILMYPRPSPRRQRMSGVLVVYDECVQNDVPHNHGDRIPVFRVNGKSKYVQRKRV